MPQPGTSLAVLGRDRRWLALAATIAVAVVMGMVLAGANWILIAVFLVLPIAWLRPRELCLGVYAFLLPFDALSGIGPAGLTLTLIAGAALTAVLLGTAMLKRELQMPPRQAWWWALFVAWAAVTVLWALDSQVAISRLPTSVALLLLYFVVVCTSISRKELRTASLFAVAGACAAAIVTIVQFYGGGLYREGARGSISGAGTSADPNYLAASLLLPLSLAVYGFLTPGRWLRRLAWLVVAAILVFAILVTGSRGAMVAVAVMILFYMYTRQVSRRMTIPLVAIFVALVFLLPSAFFARMHTTLETGGAGRTVIWEGGLVAFERHGLVGAGLDNFKNAYRESAGVASLYRGEYVVEPHNIYLAVAVETGAVGLIFLLTAVVAQLRAASRCRKKAAHSVGSFIVAYEAGCYSILVAAFFIGILWEKWFWLPWMFLAVAVRTAPANELVGARTAASEPGVAHWRVKPMPSAPGLRLR